MNHLVQTTYSDLNVDQEIWQKIWQMGGFVRPENEDWSSVTVCISSDKDDAVRELLTAK